MSSSAQKYCIGIADVVAAADRIRPYVHRTPVMRCSQLDAMAGKNVELFFKCELFQKTGSFKIRGASNACLAVPSSAAQKGFVTHSSGNHAQAVALACQQRGVPAYIVMPSNAPLPKKNAVLHTYGAKVFECKPTNAARAAMAAEKVKETGATFIHPSNNPQVIAGQGTIALEFLAQITEMGKRQLDALIVPLGGGGMLSGMTIAAKSLFPGIKVYGAEPAGANDAYLAKEAGQTAWKGVSVHPKPPNTCADGLKTCLLENNWPVVRDLVDRIFLVSEAQIIDAAELVYTRMKLAIEMSAGTGVAVALSEEFRKLGHQRVGVVLCGGNIALDSLFASIRSKFVTGSS